MQAIQNQSSLSLMSKGVEFILGNQCSVIEYADQNFREKIQEALSKYRFSDIEF